MKVPRRLPLVRSLKFAPVALISLFLFSNVTGVLFSRVMAPVASATEHTVFRIPADIPTSGDPELDRIIFEAAGNQGVNQSFIQAVIWKESKYETHPKRHAGGKGLMHLTPATASGLVVTIRMIRFRTLPRVRSI